MNTRFTKIFRVGDTIDLFTKVHLGALRPEEVHVELYYGHIKTIDAVETSHVEQMRVTEAPGSGDYTYGCTITCPESGRFGFTARVIPVGDDWIKNTPGLMTWA